MHEIKQLPKFKSVKTLSRKIINKPLYTQRVVQFGSGNFLRGFANWMIDEMNHKTNFDSGVVVVKPTDRGTIEALNTQDGLYTLYLNGIKNKKATSEHYIIDCIQSGINPYKNYEHFMAVATNTTLRFVISNTTEAGIVYNAEDKLTDRPQRSFPGKLAALLYQRFKFFKGASDKGLIILPCELIDRNGENLKKMILQHAKDWNLGTAFINWINNNNTFCNTLADRIVPGYPHEKIDAITQELGYKDDLVVEAEQFHLWVIEGPESIKNEIPSKSCGLNIVFTDNLEPYRTRKVRILNGAHTALVPVGYLYGIDKVRESVEDAVVGKFLKEVVFKEICSTLDLPKAELDQFANSVLERFLNPYLEHELMSISLNAISKFKARVLPSILEYVKRKGALPHKLLFSLSALIAFYKGERNNEMIQLNDDQSVLNFFKLQWAKGDIAGIVEATLKNTGFWGMDLTVVDGLQQVVTTGLECIVNQGMQKSLQHLMR